MSILYFLALLPLAVGLILHHFTKEICWREWVIGGVLAFITAGIAQLAIHHALTGDRETWSGEVVSALLVPAWTEQYEEAVYKTVTETKDGKTTSRQEFSHYETRTDYHPETRTVTTNAPASRSISKDKWHDLVKKLGKVTPERGSRSSPFRQNSRMVAGDRNDYRLTNITGWVEPMNFQIPFENRIRNSASILKSYKVDPERAKELYPYPKATDGFTSSRMLGNPPAHITRQEWEQLNATLGPTKRINLIVAQFSEESPYVAEEQYALWQGGKKNDMMIFYGPGWSKVYSWSDSELAKQNVQSLFLNPESPTLLEDLRKEIIENYKLVDWKERYGYITIQPTFTQVMIYLAVLIITQTGIYILFHSIDIRELAQHYVR